MPALPFLTWRLLQPRGAPVTRWLCVLQGRAPTLQQRRGRVHRDSHVQPHRGRVGKASALSHPSLAAEGQQRASPPPRAAQTPHGAGGMSCMGSQPLWHPPLRGSRQGTRGWGASGSSPEWRGTRRSPSCASCSRTSPGHRERTRRSGWMSPPGTRYHPTAAAPLTFRASWKMGTPGWYRQESEEGKAFGAFREGRSCPCPPAAPELPAGSRGRRPGEHQGAGTRLPSALCSGSNLCPQPLL